MKFLILFILAGCLYFTSPANAQSKKVTVDTIHVHGICEMCKERIENAAYIKGVKNAKWDAQTSSLEVFYRTDKTSKEEICKSIANAGHDNDLIKATDEQYAKVHACCKYREQHQH